MKASRASCVPKSLIDKMVPTTYCSVSTILELYSTVVTTRKLMELSPKATVD